MLQKSTHVYAHHGLPLECDIYTDEHTSKDTPVFLFFHSGGLVDWGRDTVPPWLVQVCVLRKWALISASYRLLPQAGAAGLLEDVSAAYAFARKWEAPEGTERRVIVGGASAGCFTAALVAHHCEPSPLALFSICGINTFHHSFFNSSTLLTEEPIENVDIAEFITGPPVVGTSPPGSRAVFHLSKLTDSGARNKAYQPPSVPPVVATGNSKYRKGDLYDYYIYKNAWLDLIGAIDPGYEWGKDATADSRRAKWPPTIIFHGDADIDVPLDLSSQMREYLGADKVKLFIAPDQGHLFENTKWIEDEGTDMDAVRAAVSELDAVVAKKT